MGFQLLNVGGRAALLDGSDIYDLETVSGGALSSCPMAALETSGELHRIDLGSAQPTSRLGAVRLGPPVPRPSKAFGVGLNYRAHAEESKMDIPEVPPIFAKFPNCICGPNDDVVLRGDRCDYEAELVVVIGMQAKDVPENEAWSFVAGLTCGQDISDRRVQFAAKPPQFALGKSFDTFGPIGPAVVSPDLVADPNRIALRCEVNGEVRQSSDTSDLIFSVPALIAYLSSVASLFPGDLIFTGTPSGVGAARGQYLDDGDVIVTRLDGLGEMTNRCVMG